MIEALIAGERDPHVPAELAQGPKALGHNVTLTPADAA